MEGKVSTEALMPAEEGLAKESTLDIARPEAVVSDALSVAAALSFECGAESFALFFFWAPLKISRGKSANAMVRCPMSPTKAETTAEMGSQG